MKKIFTILILSSLFAGELEVDGDLTVTGNIQSQTIDSLLQVIADLQSQLNALQVENRLETRVYTLHLENLSSEENAYYLDLQSLTGYDLDYGRLNILNILNYPNSDDDCNIYFQTSYLDVNNNLSWEGIYKYVGEYSLNMNIGHTGDISFINDSSIRIWKNGSGSFTGDIILSVTAQFSDSDVQLRKTGLQSKDKETVK